MAVTEKMIAVVASELANDVTNAGLIEPLVRQPGCPGHERFAAFLEHMSDHPCDIEAARAICIRIAPTHLRGTVRRVEAGATPRFEVAHRDQAVVRLDHGEATDSIAAREFADRGDACARRKDIAHLALYCRDDLVHQRRPPMR